MVGFEILIEINPTKRTEFVQAFEMINSNGSHKAGRSEIALFEHVNCSNIFLWTEYWPTHESLKQYFQSNTYRMMVGAIKVLGKIVHKRVYRLQKERDHAKI